MTPENTMLSEQNQAQKATACAIPFLEEFRIGKSIGTSVGSQGLEEDYGSDCSRGWISIQDDENPGTGAHMANTPKATELVDLKVGDFILHESYLKRKKKEKKTHQDHGSSHSS